MESKWWNIREPTFGSPWWMPLLAMAICTAVGIAELVHGSASTGWAIIGTACVISGLVYLRFLLSYSRVAILHNNDSSVQASFDFYQVGTVVAGISIGVGALTMAFFSGARARAVFDLVRHWRMEGELIATVVVASSYAIARGDERFRLPILAMSAVDTFGFLCLYLGEIRGIMLLAMPLEAIFWILQLVLLCTLFTSTLSLRSSREDRRYRGPQTRICANRVALIPPRQIP
ncbi:MAG TPA: hypothetical protein VKR29_01935 [Candidatus Binataceae bacterium]|nr:hypothetical protein [Candidatus Binataceae bacterium]